MSVNSLVEKIKEAGVVIVGTDLFQQSLLDKDVSMVFCNPPYSQYVEFMDKVLTESPAKMIFFIVPERWKENKHIAGLIESRELEYKVIESMDFLNAERKARAKVDIVIFAKFWKRTYGAWTGETFPVERDVFSKWFDEQFKINTEHESKEQPKESIENRLVDGESIVTQLLSFYNDDLQKLYNNYKALEHINAELLKEMGVNLQNLKDGLKMKIQGLKKLYWNNLFSRYDKITSRLCSFTRSKIINKLNDNTGIDFTEGNIGMVTLWVIQNANKLYNEQLVRYFKQLCNPDSIKMYKSNKRFTDDTWKYVKESLDKYWYYFVKNDPERQKEIKDIKNIMLEYRLVYRGCYRWYDDGYSNEEKSIVSFLRDTCTIAENLGYMVERPEVTTVGHWEQKHYELNHLVIKYKDGSVFADIRCYQNNNVHIKFDQKFIKHLNVEASRLIGWVNDKQEASDEMGLKESEVAMYWNKNVQYIPASNANLLEFTSNIDKEKESV